MPFYPNSDSDALLILNAVPGIGNRTARRLMDFYGSVRTIFERSFQQWREDGVLTEAQSTALLGFPAESFLTTELTACATHKIRIVTFDQPDYPDLLGEIPDAPTLLYIKGSAEVLHQPAVAIVGSRGASVYGMTSSRQLAAKLSEAGLVVISGLARGIDTAAHQGALVARGSTVAILGSGLLRIYPAENVSLTQKILAAGGALVSEFPLETEPRPYHFPRRNRIISGLSQGTVVIEAAARSGALITADFALEQGRDIYALPGKIDNPEAQGTLELIKQGAKMVTCAEDILEDYRQRFAREVFNPEPDRSAGCASGRAEDFLDDHAQLLSKMPSQKTHFNDLCQASHLPANRVAALLTQLELRHQIEQLPGKYFQRISHG